MSSSPHPLEQQIIGSWLANAEAWGDAIESGGIAPRRCGFELEEMREPLPASALFICGVREVTT
jgi:hypothetical protein